jgi:hypothetical protein
MEEHGMNRESDRLVLIGHLKRNTCSKIKHIRKSQHLAKNRERIVLLSFNKSGKKAIHFEKDGW